ncbi:MAG TPA: hypothetical protein VHZ50_06120 [Puia sp.]|nr:hypothetical protein [Puia sp.]
MKTMNFFRITILVACLGLFFACSKSNNSGTSTATTESDLQTQSDDQTMASNEDDAMNNDADAALSSNVSISGSSLNNVPSNNRVATMGVNGVDSANIICDATITFDTTSTTRTVTITYNGSNCWGNRTRTGSISISVPTGVHWGDAGATVTINVNDLKITRVRDNKTITFNGTKTITNVNGGLLKDLATLPSVTHAISASLSIVYNNGKTAEWNASKQRVFTYSDGVEISTTGTHSDGTNTNVAEWGTNRFGVSYESLITVPKVIDQSCDYRLTSGENEILDSKGATATITYGLDSTGAAATCPGSGSYYAKLVYVTPGGKTFTYIFPY